MQFVRSSSSNARTLGVIAADQTAVLMRLRRKSDIPGPGYFELLRRTDAERLVKFLVSKGPQDLFLGTELLQPGQRTMGALNPWLPENLPTLLTAYATVAADAPGGWMYLRRMEPR
jgi:hypothetical protein